jgi:prolyl-tRNA synthetase
MIWPISIAPFEVELLSLSSDSEANVQATCAEAYQMLLQHRIEVLFDERPVSPGVNFKDADLIGCPIRIAIGAKSLAKGGVELTVADQPMRIVPLNQMLTEVIREKGNLYKKLY